VSISSLILQISLTRIFSFTLWYHFAYVAISVALLGYGASGALLAVAPGLAGRVTGRRLSGYALAGGFSIVLGLLVFAEVPFHPFQVMDLLLTGRHREIPLAQVAYLLIFYAAVTLPFFFAGLCVSVALRALSGSVSRLYFFDLLGAGVGCLVVVFVISSAGTPGAVVVAAVTASLAAIAFAAAAGPTAAGVATTVAVIVALAGAGVLSIARFSPSPEKFLSRFLRSTSDAVRYTEHWSPIFRTDSFGFKNEEVSRVGSYAGWGVSPKWKPYAATRAPRLRMITHDGDAGAVIYNFDGDLAKLEMFDHSVLKVPYLLLDRPNVLVIGVGGGTDIVNAVNNRARHVTGVELDPATLDLVRTTHADFAGHLFDRPDVTTIVGEGRSTLRHSAERYDLIQLTGADTLAALSTGAYVLSESYLYTREAMREFVEHLTPDGVVSLILADYMGGPGPYPRHTMRQLSLFIDTLDALGVQDPSRHVAIVASPDQVPQVAMVLKRSAITADEARRLGAFSDDMGFVVWALPGVPPSTAHAEYLRTPRDRRAQFLAKTPLIMTAATDDNPFFFNFYRWRNLGKSLTELDVGHTLATGQIILAVMLVLAIAFSTALILLPLLFFQRQGVRMPGSLGFIVFFLAIGVGFMFIEISLVQSFVLFLGYPTYSLTVVLFSLLTYSGTGSYLTGRMTTPPEDRFWPLCAALATLTLAYVLALPAVFDAFLGSAFWLRVGIASIVLMPLGLVLGMFFPSGIQTVRRVNERFVPWAWGINGCASVVATVLAVILAMSYGFRFVTLVALSVYVFGTLGIRASLRRAREV
jgi:hypothetical protein